MNPAQAIPKVPSAVEVSQGCELGKAAQALLRPGLSSGAYFDQLCKQKLHSDAIHFAARLLGKREAVWWGCLCVWETLRPGPAAAPLEAALRAAVRWTIDPSEANRRAAQQPAEAAGITAPAGALAWGVFWSGGSMHAPELPAVPPPEHLTARMVGSALRMALTGADATETTRRELQFLRLAIEVANRHNLPPPLKTP
jgi:hypothetical protein